MAHLETKILTMPIRSISELTDVDRPAWPAIVEAISAATDVTVLSVEPRRGSRDALRAPSFRRFGPRGGRTQQRWPCG